MRSFTAAILAVSCGYATASGNMNGEYIVSSVDKTNVPFNNDFASKGHEYFDVWAPEIATHYGEVFWTSQVRTDRFNSGEILCIFGIKAASRKRYKSVCPFPQGNQPLPAHIVERFKGKVIAITGYEQDQASFLRVFFPLQTTVLVSKH